MRAYILTRSKWSRYPCINSETDYGIAVAGIKGSGDIPVSLAVDAQEEPNTRRKEPPSRMK